MPKFEGKPINLKPEVFKLAPFSKWRFSHRVERAIGSDPADSIKQNLTLLSILKVIGTHLRLSDSSSVENSITELDIRGVKITPVNIETGGRKYLIYIKPNTPGYQDFCNLIRKILPNYYQDTDKPTFRIAIKGTGNKASDISERSLSDITTVRGFTKDIKEEGIIDAHLDMQFDEEYRPARVKLVSIPISSMVFNNELIELEEHNPKYPLISGDQQANMEVYVELSGKDLEDFLGQVKRVEYPSQFIELVAELKYHPDFRELFYRLETQAINNEQFINLYLDIFLKNTLRSVIRFNDIKIKNRFPQNLTMTGDFQDFESFVIGEDDLQNYTMEIQQIAHNLTIFIEIVQEALQLKYIPQDPEAALVYNIFINKHTTVDLKSFDSKNVTPEFFSTIVKMFIAKFPFSTKTINTIFSKLNSNDKQAILKDLLLISIKAKDDLQNSGIQTHFKIIDFIGINLSQFNIISGEGFSEAYIRSILHNLSILIHKDGIILADQAELGSVLKKISNFKHLEQFQYLQRQLNPMIRADLNKDVEA